MSYTMLGVVEIYVDGSSILSDNDGVVDMNTISLLISLVAQFGGLLILAPRGAGSGGGFGLDIVGISEYTLSLIDPCVFDSFSQIALPDCKSCSKNCACRILTIFPATLYSDKDSSE